MTRDHVENVSSSIKHVRNPKDANVGHVGKFWVSRIHWLPTHPRPSWVVCCPPPPRSRAPVRIQPGTGPRLTLSFVRKTKLEFQLNYTAAWFLCAYQWSGLVRNSYLEARPIQTEKKS